MTATLPRPEYPRPQFERSDWLNLNGAWDFAYDDGDTGVTARWYEAGPFGQTIQVPFAFQSRLSGIGDTAIHDIVWYRRGFDLPAGWADQRILLHFGAVDYAADVWVNGVHVTRHEGGHVGFGCEITPYVTPSGNTVVVRAQDDTLDRTLPRGKQYWRAQSESIFYTRTTGIWQTVWLEAVPTTHLAGVRMTPDLDARQVAMDFTVAGPPKGQLEVTVCYGGVRLSTDYLGVEGAEVSMTWKLQSWALTEMGFHDDCFWTPEHPNLFDVVFTLRADGQREDRVQSYFALRKVGVEGGRFQLNNLSYYQKLLLDQGYWPDSLLTPPSDEAIRYDIEMSKAMGFNGCRKHQKVEDPRFLYWADKLGFLVWGEMANAYLYSVRYVARFTREWMEVVERDYNHPCIVAWTPLNESWGVEDIAYRKDQQAHAAALYYLIKSLDQTRPVVSNDGWQHAQTDLLTIHDYESNGDVLRQRYGALDTILACQPANRSLFAQGWSYEGQPILTSEVGGISYRKGSQEGWGYSTASDDADYARRYHAVISALLASPHIQGFVYTQTTDVEQEINGVMTYDRKPKLDPAVFKAINEGVWRPEE